MTETPIPGSAEAIAAAEMLEYYAGIYPGDISGNMTREACELRGIPYDPPQVVITYGEPAPLPHPQEDKTDG